MKHPVFGSLGGMCLVGFWGCATFPLLSSTIAIFGFLALFCSFSTKLLGFSIGFLALFCSFSTKLMSSALLSFSKISIVHVHNIRYFLIHTIE